jgi:FkbM family methyltransferase
MPDRAPGTSPSVGLAATGNAFRRAARTWLARLGRGPAGSTAIRLIAFLSRHRALSSTVAGAAVLRATSLRPDSTFALTRTLGHGRSVRFGLDLRYSGCLELLVAPVPGAPDIATAALLVALAREADLVLDVGANVGLYTYLVAASTARARVICLEPTPGLASFVTDTVARNGWESRVQVRLAAAGAAAGTSTLYVLSGSDTENTLDADRIAGREHRALDVAVVPLDEVVRDDGARLAKTVIKVDVEGHEDSALDGLRQTLRGPGERPDVIMEFLGRAIEREHIIERVLGFGLDVYYIGPQGLTPLFKTADLAPVHALGHWNFFLTARPPADVRHLASRAGVRVNGGQFTGPASTSP